MTGRYKAWNIIFKIWERKSPNVKTSVTVFHRIVNGKSSVDVADQNMNPDMSEVPITNPTNNSNSDKNTPHPVTQAQQIPAASVELS